MTSIRQPGFLSRLQPYIDIFDDADNWTESDGRCDVCLKKNQGVSCHIPDGRVCIPCVEAGYRDFAGKQEIAAWHHSRFVHALFGKEALRWRLTILNRYAEAFRIVEKQKSSDVNAMQRLLILNLGALIDHPLGQMVRNWAFQAVVQVGKAILPVLLEYRDNRDPWQFYVNVVLCAGLIAPDDDIVRQLLEEAASHPNIEVRKKFFFCRTGQSTVSPVADELSPLETDIVNSYSTDTLKDIYSRYLRFLFQETDFQVKGAFAAGKLRKRQLVWALAQAFSRPDLFEKLVRMIPQGVMQVLTRLTWEKGGLPIQSFTEPLDPPILVRSETSWRGRSQTTETFNPCYALIAVQKKFSYQSFVPYPEFDATLMLPDLVREQFKKHLPSPEGYHLKGQDTVEKTDFVYEDGNHILRQIYVLGAYIAQGNLKYAKNKAVILKTSLKEMAAYCHIREFYDGKNPDLEHLTTRLIVDFLQHHPLKESPRSPENLRQMFDAFFTKVDLSGGYRLSHLLFHLRGVHRLHDGYYEYGHREKELNVRSTLRDLIRALSPGLWYSVPKLLDYCRFREMDLDIVDRRFAANYLSFDIRDDAVRNVHYWTSTISSPNYQEALIAPFFKGFLFLLAAFGVVDIAYDFPKNERMQKKGMGYLSVFDGLHYVRLTSLGAFVAGLTKVYAFQDDLESASLVLDDKRLLVHLAGKDRLKAMVLEQIAEKIGQNCYAVTSGSFLKSCNSRRDIENKVRLFRKQVSAKPPRIWEDFLGGILDKMDPLIPEPALSVFRLKDNPELIALMASDEILQKYILKAEGHHVLISGQALHKVKKRLETFGYFIAQLG